MTVEEYFRFDEGSPTRHEYVAGEAIYHRVDLAAIAEPDGAEYET
jgi:hypothetical protein